MTWILKDPENRIPHFDQFLPYIRFPHMQKYFYLDVIPQMANYFKEPMRSQILKAQSLALEYNLGGLQRLKRMNSKDMDNHQLVPRLTIQNPLQLTFKCIFKKVSGWDLNGRYYSDPVFAHGYEIEIILSGNPADTLEVFLNCTSRLMPVGHSLPICCMGSILRGNLELKLTPYWFVFEVSEDGQQLFLGKVLMTPFQLW